MNNYYEKLLQEGHALFTKDYIEIQEFLKTYSWKFSSSWFSIKFGPISNSLSLSLLDDFIKKIPSSDIYCVIPCILSEGRITSLSQQLFLINSSSSSVLYEYINHRINIKTFNYDYQLNDTLFFKIHPIKPDKDVDMGLVQDLKKQIKKVKNHMKDANNNVSLKLDYLAPLTLDLKNYGVIKETNFKSPHSGKTGSLFEFKGKLIFIDTRDPKVYFGEVFNKNLDFLCSYEDSISTYRFERKFVKDNINIVVDRFPDSISSVSGVISSKFIPIGNKLKSDEKNDKNKEILTLDIETYVDNNNVFVPYAIGFFDGESSNTYFLSDYKSSDAMIIDCLKNIMSTKNDKKNIYIHNGANFDSVFLTKPLARLFKIKPLYHKNKLIKMDVIDPKNNVSITILDSYQILKGSLKDLSQAFDVPVPKGDFPHKFITKDNLDYIGKTPGIEYYSGDVKVEINDNWNLRNECIIYLKADLKSLYDILTIARDVFLKTFCVDMCKFYTISGLSSHIWAKNYAEHEDVPIISGKSYDFIQKGFYGGVNLVINPFAENIDIVDYNSSYPDAMLNDMPIGEPTFVKTNKLEDIEFGFAKIKFKTPANIEIPVLPVKTVDGVIYPVGLGEGVYSTEDIKLAQELGYEIQVFEGLKFKRGKKVFTSFVQHFHKLKAQSTGAARIIFKLILNSLFGRLGLNESHQVTKIVNKETTKKIIKYHQTYLTIHISDDEDLISYELIPDPLLCKIWGNNKNEDTLIEKDLKIPTQSIASAAMVSSYARIHLFRDIRRIKYENPNQAIHYMDTDSLALNNKNKGVYLGENLGQFSLKHENVTGYFLAPKLYGLVNKDNSNIVKGRTSELTIDHIIKLYKENATVQIETSKWYKNIESGYMEFKNILLNITSSDIKRNKLYSLGEWVGTSPLCIKNNEIITQELTIYKPKELTIYKNKEIITQEKQNN